MGRKVRAMGFAMGFALASVSLSGYGQKARLTSPLVEDLCSRITKPSARDALLRQQDGVEDINNDGRPERAERCSGGEMETPCARYYAIDGKEILIVEEGFEWQDFQTFGRHAFRFRGHTFFLNSARHTPTHPVYVSYITPHNREHVVCEFRNERNEIVVASDGKYDRVCKAVASMSAQQDVVFADQGIVVPEAVRPRNASRDSFGSIGTARVDVDNDGKPDLVMQLSITSGFGRGCSASYFEILDDDGMRMHPEEKSHVFGEFQRPYWAVNCGSMSNRLFEYEGQIYYEGNALGTDDAPHVVAILEGAKIVEACTFQEAIQTTLFTVNERFLTTRSSGRAGARR